MAQPALAPQESAAFSTKPLPMNLSQSRCTMTRSMSASFVIWSPIQWRWGSAAKPSTTRPGSAARVAR
eukprot:8747352-Lingulodinium_polyedra.AAC.1